jgi:hypothetical protein
MKRLRNLAVALALSFSAASAYAANVLIVLSDADHLDLKDGKVFRTGFYLNELMQPVKALRDAGRGRQCPKSSDRPSSHGTPLPN